MVTSALPRHSPAFEAVEPPVARIARATGVLYLLYFVVGMIDEVLVRGKLYAPDDAALTFSHLVDRAGLARLDVALELGIVLIQALIAVLLYRLFHRVDSFAAGTLAAFGLVNAVAIMGSTAMLATALDLAHNPSVLAAGEPSATTQMLYVASNHFWGVGSLFFGLWLLPMGWLVLRSHWMPKRLGQVLIVGGIGYAISAFVTSAFRGADVASFLLQVPSIVGELWIMGYLVLFGVRPHAER